MKINAQECWLPIVAMTNRLNALYFTVKTCFVQHIYMLRTLIEYSKQHHVINWPKRPSLHFALLMQPKDGDKVLIQFV